MEEYQSIFKAANEVSIDAELTYINEFSVLYGLLFSKNSTNPFFSQYNKENLRREIQFMLKNSYKFEEEDVKEKLPVTVRVEDLVKKASSISYSIEKTPENLSLYTLISLLSFSKPAQKVLMKEGILLGDVLEFFNIEHLQHLVELNKPKGLSKWDKAKFVLAKHFHLNFLRKKLSDKLFSISVLYLEQDDYENSLKYLNLKERLDGELAFDELSYKSLLHLKMRDFEDSIRIYEKLQYNDQYGDEEKINYALALSGFGDIETSNKLNKEIIDSDSQNTVALNNLGYGLTKRGDYDQAIEVFKKAIEINPYHAYAYNNMGLAYLKLNNLEKAHSYIEKSLSFDRGNAYAYKNRALLNIAKDKMEAALEDLHLAEKYGFSKKYGSKVEEIRQMYFPEV